MKSINKDFLEIFTESQKQSFIGIDNPKEEFVGFGFLNYDGLKKLNKLDVNRDVKQTYVQAHKKNMLNGYYDSYTPIKVSVDSLNIIDGQHEVEALFQLVEDESVEQVTKKNTLKVIWVRYESLEAEREAVRRENSSQLKHNWTSMEKIESYAKDMSNPERAELYEAYVEVYNKYHELYGFNQRTVIGALCGKNADGQATRGELGKYVTLKNFNYLDIIIKEVALLRDTFGIGKADAIAYFTIGWYNIRKAIPIDLMLELPKFETKNEVVEKVLDHAKNYTTEKDFKKWWSEVKVALETCGLVKVNIETKK